jgi:hypothetical protein
MGLFLRTGDIILGVRVRAFIPQCVLGKGTAPFIAAGKRFLGISIESGINVARLVFVSLCVCLPVLKRAGKRKERILRSE